MIALSDLAPSRGGASRLASSRRVFARIIRQQTPTNRPVLRPQLIAPLNRTCPVVEITRAHWPAVHEPHDSRPAFHGVDQCVCAGIVGALHSPHDRRLIVGRRQDDFRHGNLTYGKGGTILQTSRVARGDVPNVTESLVGKTKRLSYEVIGDRRILINTSFRDPAERSHTSQLCLDAPCGGIHFARRICMALTTQVSQYIT